MQGSQVLYRKYRPQKFSDLVNQDHVKQTLLNEIRFNKISHAYLFAGPRGTGKTTMARLLAKAINCQDNQDGEPCGKCQNCLALIEGRMLDLIEIDAASHTGVDDVRSLIEKVNLAPAVGKYKVYIIDEAHMLSKNAFNALLKTLEEPPSHAIFILATTEVHKLLPTIVSRCQYFDFHHLGWEAITNYLKQIAAKEEISITDEAIAAVAEGAEGSLRDALSILDQVASLNVTEVDRQTLEGLLGIVDVQIVRELTESILSQNITRGIDLIGQAYHQGYDLNQLLKRWMVYVRELMMVSLGNDSLISRSEDEKTSMRIQAKGVDYKIFVNLLQRLAEANSQYKVASMPQLALEMVLFGAIKPSSHSVPPPTTTNVDSKVPKPDVTLPSVSSQTPLSQDLWLQICQKISTSNSALASLLRGSTVKCTEKQIVIELPSEFLKNIVKKQANVQVISEMLKSFGQDLEIELVVKAGATEEAREKVAEVFDIIQS
ncbi:DNA polymerase III subunit gamma/tau [Patescibacteria group bacterium]|nr:DNA polymerase III subunit gamma/tau [Patescibacteria group bacterium]